MFGENIYQSNALYCPCLFHETNDLFKYDKKVAIFEKKKKKKKRKNRGVPPTISNKFDISRLQIVGLKMCKIGRGVGGVLTLKWGFHVAMKP